MPYSCAVATCVNHGRRTKSSGIFYHRFPKNIDLRKKWIQLCRRVDRFSAENSRICSIHFDKEDYQRDLKAELLKLTPKMILKNTTVPHLNLDLSGCLHQEADSSTKERLQNRDAKKIVNSLLEETSSNSEGNAGIVWVKSEISPPSLCVTLAEVDDMKSEAEDLRHHNSSLEQKVQNLENELQNMQSEMHRLRNIECAFQQMFSSCQQQFLLTGKCKNWDPDDISKAIALRCISRQAYDFVKDCLKYPLPSDITIKRRFSQYT